jgi:hypothetical protein
VRITKHASTLHYSRPPVRQPDRVGERLLCSALRSNHLELYCSHLPPHLFTYLHALLNNPITTTTWLPLRLTSLYHIPSRLSCLAVPTRCVVDIPSSSTITSLSIFILHHQPSTPPLSPPMSHRSSLQCLNQPVPYHSHSLSPSASSPVNKMPHPHRTSSQDSTSADGLRKRVCKACDRCRLKKSKCDGSSPCSRCKSDNAICVFGSVLLDSLR